MAVSKREKENKSVCVGVCSSANVFESKLIGNMVTNLGHYCQTSGKYTVVETVSGIGCVTDLCLIYSLI